MAPDRTVPSGRAALATFVSGGGDPVVFVHANVCDSRMWQAQVAAVGASRMAVAYDRRGFGRTPAASEDHSPVADLMAVIQATCGSTPATLVGCSMGGKIAVDAALRHPDRIAALVLIAPSVSGAPDAVHPPEIDALFRRQQEAQASGDPDRIAPVMARLWLDGPLAPEGRVNGPARSLFLDMSGVALRSGMVGRNLDVAPAFGRLAELRLPSLLIWGDLDFPHIQDRCRLMVDTMPGASGEVLAGAAHLPSLECPARVTAPLLAFLDRVGTAGAGSREAMA